MLSSQFKKRKSDWILSERGKESFYTKLTLYHHSFSIIVNYCICKKIFSLRFEIRRNIFYTALQLKTTWLVAQSFFFYFSDYKIIRLGTRRWEISDSLRPSPKREFRCIETCTCAKTVIPHSPVSAGYGFTSSVFRSKEIPEFTFTREYFLPFRTTDGCLTLTKDGRDPKGTEELVRLNAFWWIFFVLYCL